MIQAIKEFYNQYLKIENPFSHQIELWERIEERKFPILLKAPTGSGKTEAVLAPFLKQFMENKFPIAPRLIYVLPMRVLVNSVAERIKTYAQNISPAISVKIHHGDIPNSPFFISDIIITTLDQFVYGFARSSKQVSHHIDLPAGAIASSLVVFDEAHLYRDEFTFSVMRAIMEILHESKIPFVVMTATIPESLENSLFENIGDYEKIESNLSISGKINWKIAKDPLYSNSEANLSTKILENIKGKKTLIIVNQVKRAQEIYKEVKKRLELNESQIVLLHSRFTKIDRQEHEKKAISMIPHKENGKLIIPKNVGIVISTQVLEAGIDFSAEFLLTELAPADALIQRIGRCARYSGETGEVVIFPVECKYGHRPYRKEHIEKTLKWLRKNSNFDFRDFDEICRFVNETLDYKANDYEASDTLIDLYECVLYADQKPQNIQVRDGKPATILVVEPVLSEKKERKKENQLLYGINNIYQKGGEINDYSFEVDIKTAWAWFENKLIQYELIWVYDEKENNYKSQIKNLFDRGSTSPSEKDPRVGPFRTYIMEKVYYDSLIGVKNDDSIFI